jgi:hypothetical protein
MGAVPADGPAVDGAAIDALEGTIIGTVMGTVMDAIVRAFGHVVDAGCDGGPLGRHGACGVLS